MLKWTQGFGRNCAGYTLEIRAVQFPRTERKEFCSLLKRDIVSRKNRLRSAVVAAKLVRQYSSGGSSCSWMYHPRTINFYKCKRWWSCLLGEIPFLKDGERNRQRPITRPFDVSRTFPTQFPRSVSTFLRPEMITIAVLRFPEKFRSFDSTLFRWNDDQLGETANTSKAEHCPRV